MNPTSNLPSPTATKKYAFSGKLRVGKDYIAEQCGATTLIDHTGISSLPVIIGFADPFYVIAAKLFGQHDPSDKDKLPGLRDFYQKLGQYGRGVVNEQYPLTPERATFVQMMRTHGPVLAPGFAIEWETYGLNSDIWVHGLLARSQRLEGKHAVHDINFDENGKSQESADDPSKYPVQFVTNVRFENELTALTPSGFEHFHVLCSDETYGERLRDKGIRPDDARLSDYSEQFARQLDREVGNILRTHETGSKLKVIWNDYRPCPSPRLFTLEQFAQYVKQNEEKANERPENPDTTVAEETTGTTDAREGNEVLDALTNATPDSEPDSQDARR